MAGTVFILGEGGGVFELQLPLHETIADRLAKGHLRRVKPDGSPYVEDERPAGVPSLPESRPNVNAVKAEWVGWAVAQGLTPDDAEALTKAELIERFGQADTAAEQTDTAAEQTDTAAEPAAEQTDTAAEPAAPETAPEA